MFHLGKINYKLLGCAENEADNHDSSLVGGATQSHQAKVR